MAGHESQQEAIGAFIDLANEMKNNGASISHAFSEMLENFVKMLILKCLSQRNFYTEADELKAVNNALV